MKSITVNASGRYEIRLGAGILPSLGTVAKRCVSGRRAMIVTDENVAPLYCGAAERSLKAAGFSVDSIVIPPGEESKSFPSIRLSASASRRSAIRAAIFGRAGRGRRGGSRGLCRGDVPQGNCPDSGSDHAARHAGFFGRRKDGNRPFLREKPGGRVLAARRGDRGYRSPFHAPGARTDRRERRGCQICAARPGDLPLLFRARL